MYFNRFTQRAKRSIDIGIESAQRLGHKVVGSEHILFGLIKEKEGIAGKVLMQLGLTDSIIKSKIIEVKGNANEPVEDVTLSPRSKQILELSGMFANKLRTNYIGTEHILLAIVQEGNGTAMKILNLEGIDERAIVQLIIDMMGLEEYSIQQEKEEKYTVKVQEESLKLLDKYGKNLVNLASKGKLDPVVGREIEIERVIQILSRRTKNNPVVIGDPGVGKTSIIEGLAINIAEGNVPETLKNKSLYTLNMGSMLAGAKYRGEFEDRIKQVIDEVIKNGNVILFIDEIHTIIGAGATGESTIDASNILKPVLSRGELQIIGATTIDEYRKHIEKDSALERRFQPVVLKEPSREESIKILEGIRYKYEDFHKVKISNESLVAAVDLSIRYITDRFLPDKAIDLIDEAASRVRLKIGKSSVKILGLEEEIESIDKEKDKAVMYQDFEKIDKIKKQQENLKKELKEVKQQWNAMGKYTEVVKPEDIAEVVELWTSIPVNKIVESESSKLLRLEKILHERVVGQEQAVKSISRAIRRSRAGLKDPNRPIGSFLFLGPTGVGKTELSKALAEVQFGDENKIIRLDMSEYMEKHAVSRLIGSPPGYVGYEEGGQLTEKVRRDPYSVILLDEIEKAHIDVFNILLQILDDGRLTDSKGRTVDFKNTIIIMTSNVGATKISSQRILGFSTNRNKEEKVKSDYENMKECIMEEVKQKFRPEFLNRIDDIIVFHSLTEEDLDEIVKLMTKELASRLQAMNINLNMTEESIRFISKVGLDLQYGARPLKRAIQKEIENPLSEVILKGDIRGGNVVIAEVENNKIVFKCK
ncbi:MULTISPECIES: ATP-dependent Clp protease ATP-binding subunit [unclassified Romboutsia]|uniref:ATP-dependent Clp protease ATP-binding subunit n=1 Tax=unclassified Romboutsia TaxID=2626894 RepID=UPI00189879BF|nr:MULTISPECIES: ATP-dependent Clp protease ATP-binding subunit [unclassified Romboutsia]MDB8806131.1 ATP-dependent Clp protease ATP-binding subunit [Romboutsia sp. 1001216sp1]MDB8808943.1 ATP-dependent Clp protease ATP-binding subunit [Romboutsia sp. 1001216sp1]MDB8811808.1 ATP-dependent Clp protease ATP-binding subunit [Romboutsia sp. 1001216sp1]MDB8817495.1 ATP-dependent Clp protease ATP-binding subunit [Romboutsia sp. 1001216sp1]MDB8820382.1 ATP-dependent Clp protease ATP-binding subunit [